MYAIMNYNMKYKYEIIKIILILNNMLHIIKS